jgi:transcriptional regulator of nitric oxide reductase
MAYSAEASSHAWPAGATSLLEASSHVYFCSIEDGATVTGSVVVWDVTGFQYLLQRHSASDSSLAGQVIMVEAASTTSMCTSVETLDRRSGNVDDCLRRALVEGGGSKIVFGDENLEIDLWLDSLSSAHVWRSLLEGLA